MTYALQLAVNGLISGSIYALMGLGVAQLYKSTGVFNFAQGELLLFGAFVFWIALVQLQWPLWLCLIVGVVAAGLLGVFTQRVFLRPLIGQPFFAMVMVTLGLSIAYRGAMAASGAGSHKIYPAIFPTGTLYLGDIVLSVQYVIIFAVAIALSIAFLLFFQYSRLGLLMRATAEDQHIAQSVGINVGSIFTYSWMAGGIMAFVAGVLLAMLYGVDTNLMATLGLKALPVVMLGGLESIAGAVIAGLLIGMIEILAAGYLDPLVGGGVQEIVPFVVLVLILLIRPTGLFGQKKIERV